MFDADKYNYPAFVLDKELKIIKRNKAASVKYSPYRLKSSISHYVNKCDLQSIKSLKEGKSVIVVLSSGMNLSAAVFFDGESYLVRTNSTALSLRERVLALCGYQKSINSSISILMSPSADKNQTNNLMLKHALHVQQRINDYFEFVLTSSSELRKNISLGEVLKRICKASKNVLSAINADILCITTPYEISSFMGMKDLEYVLFSAISLCFMLTDGKRIEARLEANGNTAVISFGVPELSEKGIVSKMEKCIKTGDFASPYQEAAFTYMYIKELCLSIGGDVTITNHVSDTRCVISVLLPCNVSEGEICLADDTEENEYLLSAQTELANVLIKYRN